MNKGCFTSERLKGNKFALGNKPNKTSFRKGHRSPNAKPDYEPRTVLHSRDGFQVICTIPEKRIAVSRGRKYKARKRTSFARVIVGLKNIPYGSVIYHRDGNPMNNSKKNLEIITRAELIKRNRKS